MKAALSLFVLSVFSASCLADPSCNGLIRTGCQNIHTAQKCGMLVDCLTVWRDSRWGKYQTDVSAECTFCLHLADTPENERSVSLLCASPPTVTYGMRTPVFNSETCQRIVTGLKNVSSGKDDAVAVCNVLEHCHSHTYIGHLNFGSTVCDDCKKVVVDVRNLISDNATAEAIKKKLDYLICGNVPEQFRDFCTHTVEVHVQPTLDLISRQICPQDICALFGLCSKPAKMVATLSQILSPELFSADAVPSSQVTHVNCPEETKFSWIARPSAKNHPKWVSIKKPEGLLPALRSAPSGAQCVAVLNQIRTSLKDPSRQAEIKEQIDKEVCDTLPTFLRSMCKGAVNEHFDEMMEHLDKVDLKQICAAFGMPSDDVHSASTSTSVTLPGACKVCEILMAKLIDVVIKGATEKEISDALDHVCRLVPRTYQDECDKFVEQYGGKIVTALITGAAPELFCMSFGMCASTTSLPVIVPPPSATDAFCDYCKLLVTMVEHQLTQNETEKEVENLMNQLCAMLPSSYVEECKSLVDKYLPAVMDYLTNHVKPQDVCEAISLCSPKPHPSLCMRGPSYWCSSRAAAVQCKAEAYCNRTFPTLERKQCETEDLDKICGSSELAEKCGKSNECLNRQMVHYLKLVSQHTQEALPVPNFSQNCTVCKQLVARWQLHKMLFGAPIVNGDTCGTYKEKGDRDQCNIVMKNRDGIFKLLVQKATDAEAMCKSLALCHMSVSSPGGSSVETQPVNVGAQVLACSEGPVYWCASPRNAEACGTVNFCKALSWFGEETKPKPTNLFEVEVDIFGVNACAWGSVYWCQNEETAKRCDALDHCKTVVWRNERPGAELRKQVVSIDGTSNPCSWGPSYYCSSPEKAVKCGPKYVKHCWQLAKQRNHA